MELAKVSPLPACGFPHPIGWGENSSNEGSRFEVLNCITHVELANYNRELVNWK